MKTRKNRLKAVAIAFMIGGILFLHYFTFHGMKFHHAVYRMLFYLPLVLGSLWFGLKGALYVSVSVSILFLPYAMIHWQGFSLEDFSRLLEGALYLAIGVILGFLVEKERKRHRALLHAESLAAVGKAVSEIAHDMKTPLMAIGGFASLVSRKLHTDDPSQKKLDVIIHETSRLESMVKEMLDFGRPLELELTKANLNEVVQEAIQVAHPMARKAGVRLEADLEPSLPSLLIDIPKIKQVLLNLVANAVQVSAAGEQVLVKTNQIGNNVFLEVIDCGCGIEQDVAESIFIPFFSTRKEGTGLGLAIVRKIVEAHGGKVSFDGNREKGTAFIVRLPIS